MFITVEVERGQVGSISALDGRASLIHISKVKEGGTMERHLEIVGGKWPCLQIGREERGRIIRRFLRIQARSFLSILELAHLP